mgnify:CR=1 FL=1
MARKDEKYPAWVLLALVLALIAMSAERGHLVQADELSPAEEQATTTSSSRWSPPVLVSTTTWFSWFPDIAVDDAGRAYLVWASGTTRNGQILDQVLFSMWDGTSWLRPNDIFAPSTGGWNVRPVIAIDNSGQLHMIYREYTNLRYTQTLAESAEHAVSWRPGRLISGSGGGYYSALAVDSQGTIHVAWSEFVFSEPTRPVIWFGTEAGAVRLMENKGELYQAAEGLTNRAVYAIWEDTAGNQWFGTAAGAFRFDGVNWLRITAADGLADSEVHAIYEDRQGGIWFGTVRGVSRLDPLNTQGARGYSAEQIRLKTYTSADGLAGDGVNAIIQDRQGNLWFGTDNGLSRFDGTNWTSYRQGSGSHDLNGKRVLALHVDRLGVLWVGTDRGLMRIEGENWQRLTSADGLAGDKVYAILEDPQGMLWFGTDRGVSRYDGIAWRTESGAGEGPVYALLLDSDGVYWFGTEKGLVRYDGKTWQTLSSDQGGGRVLALAQDKTVNALCPNCSDIFYRRSTDNGVTWSAPVNLSRSPTGSTKPQIKLDGKGGVYVTWDEGWDFYAGRGSPQSVAYTYSLDNGQTWSTPTIFRAPTSIGAAQQITLGIDGAGRLVVVWRVEAGLRPESREVYYQVSSDRGRTWSAPRRLAGVNARDWLTGLDNYTAATDSAGHVHLALVTQTDEITSTQYSLVHLEWDGLRWSAPEAVFASEDLPEWPRLAIGGGNQVFLTWFVRPKEEIWSVGHYTVWASHMEADAPRIVSTPLPTPLPSPTPTPVPPTSTPTPLPLPPHIGGEQGEIGGRPNLDYSAVATMAMAALPAMLWLAVVIGVRRFRHKG